MRRLTLCAYRCCCRLTAVAAPCRALESALEFNGADDRSEARVLEVRALCIIVRVDVSLREVGNWEGFTGVQMVDWRSKTSLMTSRAHGNFEMLIQWSLAAVGVVSGLALLTSSFLH